MRACSKWLSIGLRDLAFTACFLGALNLESPGPDRLTILVVLFVLLLGWVNLRDLPRIAGHHLVYMTYIVVLRSWGRRPTGGKPAICAEPFSPTLY